MKEKKTVKGKQKLVRRSEIGNWLPFSDFHFPYRFPFSFNLFLIPLAHAVETEVGPVSGLPQYINELLKQFIFPILGGLALLMLIYAGYLYMTSQGNPEQTGRAKDIIIGVVTGIVLLFLIEAIMKQLGR